VPLLWQVLSNKYGHDIQFGSHHDFKGKTSKSMRLKSGKKKSPMVVIYPVDSTTPVPYEGLNKFDPLSKFFNSVLDGTADLKLASEEVILNEGVIDIQQKQHDSADDSDKAAENGPSDKDAPKETQIVMSEEGDPDFEKVVSSMTREDEQVIFEDPDTYKFVEPEETESTVAPSPSVKPVEEPARDEL